MSNLELLPINIAGEWRLGGGGESTTLYPATGEVVGRLRAPSLEDVEEAIQKADHAFRTSGWAQKKPHERAAVLHRVAQLIRERAEPLAQLQRLDNGKPIKETRMLVASAAATFQFFAAACETMEETITPSRGDFMTMSVYEPMGVVAAITPWNSPIASEAQKLAPALAAGNAVVVKPAEATPLLALELAKICEEAGVPKGLVSVLPGRGSVIGDAITKHPLVKRVSFTGGTSTGKHIAHIAADKMMPVSLELGGKSATMVLADADIDHAVNGVLYGIFSSSGESCIAGSRLVLHEVDGDPPRPFDVPSRDVPGATVRVGVVAQQGALQQLRRPGFGLTRIAVNVSGASLGTDAYVEGLLRLTAAVLAAAGLTTDPAGVSARRTRPSASRSTARPRSSIQHQ